MASNWRKTALRRYSEFQLIGRDPVLMLGLLISASFVFLFVVWPLLRVVVQGFFVFGTRVISLEYFARYIDPYFARHNWYTLRDTMTMGLATATGGTILGFIVAFTLVRCSYPFQRVSHALSLIPTISPPFAIAIAVILLFGRAGLITKDWLGINFALGVNDIYGLDGLVLVQIITFFPVAYLIIRAMLERLDPAMEEAAQSLGASKLHILRTVTLPLLVPGFAGSFLLLFVESLADLGNPLLLTGTRNVLSTEIFLAVNGEYNQQKAAALSLVLLIPTLTVFIVQRYWVSRRSYVSITGKPTGGQLQIKEWYIRWPFIILTSLSLLLVAVLYAAIAVGSFTRLWGVDFSFTLVNYAIAFNRGMEAILDTTFLSAITTPIAGVLGMIIAFLVVRRQFSGKEGLDFVSNLGAAVPGTILGIGFIIAFIGPPLPALIIIFGAFLLYLMGRVQTVRAGKWLAAAVGLGIGLGLVFFMPRLIGEWWGDWYIAVLALVLTIFLLLFGVFSAERKNRRLVLIILLAPIIGLLLFVIGPFPTEWLATFGRSLGGMGAKIVTSMADWIDVFTQVPLPAHGLLLVAIGGYVMGMFKPKRQLPFTVILLAIGVLLVFAGKPLALVGTSYIIIAAYAVRSLPASLRAGVASLQQIDPAIEEASTSLGADAQITFRRVTLPLIAPAFLAGLIFAFARHMTSLSAIIFLTTPKWKILTVLILSEVEQGGMNIATAYAMIVIVIVLVAIGLFYLFMGRVFRTDYQDMGPGDLKPN
ncbi:MAG TPA: ABC transporter permease subunit [Caldilineae bacterium]|nr:ABC transporter permease subunit [Caldilineae bacterium]